MARAEAGQQIDERIDELLDAIAELQRMIDTSPAVTLEDAEVKLRRLGAYNRAGPAGAAAGRGSERRGAGAGGDWPAIVFREAF